MLNNLKVIWKCQQQIKATRQEIYKSLMVSQKIFESLKKYSSKIDLNKEICFNQLKQMQEKEKQAHVSQTDGDKHMIFQNYLTHEQMKPIANQLAEFKIKKFESHELYSLQDSLQKIKFQKKIKTTPQILLILKLKNGVILAAYSEKQVFNDFGKSFIMNLNNQEVFFPENHSRTFIYDNSYFIFGNSQIRLTLNSMKVYSNFGSLKSFFNTRKKELKDFWGENNRQLQIEDFKIFHLKPGQ